MPDESHNPIGPFTSRSVEKEGRRRVVATRSSESHKSCWHQAQRTGTDPHRQVPCVSTHARHIAGWCLKKTYLICASQAIPSQTRGLVVVSSPLRLGTAHEHVMNITTQGLRAVGEYGPTTRMRSPSRGRRNKRARNIPPVTALDRQLLPPSEPSYRPGARVLLTFELRCVSSSSRKCS
jgi:hypothetical protein